MELEKNLKNFYINLVGIFGILILGGFSIYNFIVQDYPIAVFEGILVFICVASLTLYHTGSEQTARNLGALVVFAITLHNFNTGGIEGTGLYLTFLFPPIIFILQNKKNAFYWVFTLIISIIAIVFFELIGLRNPKYPNIDLTIFLIAFNSVAGMMYLYQSSQERDRAEISLQRSLAVTEKKRLSIIIESVEDAVIVTDANKKIITFNKAAQELTGFSKLDSIGSLITKILHIKDLSSQSDLDIAKVLEKGSESPQRINRLAIYNRSNFDLPVMFYSSRIRNLGNQNPGYIVVLRKVDDVEKLNQMKDDFVYIASHQLKTPLTAIKWIADTLLKKNDSLSKGVQKEMIGEILQSNMAMLALVKDLLEASQIDNNQKIKVNKSNLKLIKLLDSIKAERELIINDKKLTINFSNAVKNIELLADPLKFPMVIGNIFDNAILYSKNHGIVNVDCIIDSQYTIISIEDSGIGIAESDKQLVFSKFYRGKNAKSTKANGTGLGLYIAKAVIDAHGGEIWFNSKENKGSTFFIKLPNSIKTAIS